MSTTSAMPNTPPTPLTLGMRLDQWLAHLDSLTSTQLYGVIVVVTVALCFALLGSGTSLDVPPPPGIVPKHHHSSRERRGTVVSPKKTTTNEPRWHILLYINVLATLGFLGSVAYFSVHAATYWQDSQRLLQFLVGWSVFLCYFFGFFGISFVHDHVPEASSADENDDGSNEMAPQTAAAKDSNEASTVAPRLGKPSLKCNDETSGKSIKASCCYDNETTQPMKHVMSSPPPPGSASLSSTSTCHGASTRTSGAAASAAETTKTPINLKELSNDQICQMVLSQQVKDHELEARLDPNRAVVVRRMAMNLKVLASRQATTEKDALSNDTVASLPLDDVPAFPSLDYSKVYGTNCEIVVGYVPIPIGLVGPLTLNNEPGIYIPMATTEGCLVASTNRGVKAISEGGGAFSSILRDGITRAPCVRMESAMEAVKLATWVKEPNNAAKLKAAFESTTSFGKLLSILPTVAGKNVYLRLECFSGDAMGMNMVSKGSLAVIELLQQEFPSLTLVALSGNMCTDKKAAATNWIHGRGKSVVVEATIPKHVVRTLLKTTVEAMVQVNVHKNLIGSAMAGTSVGGFNAHASNIVTAIFIATGQDPAQNVESSNCITLLEETPEGDLWISCTMPSLEVGTVGGGTSLSAQAACLNLLQCRGSSPQSSSPGQHAQRLAQIIAAATMAGELSLLAALAANTLVQAHMTHNRKKG